MFTDREDAGRQLARVLLEYDLSSAVIVALPRGGVPVGFEIARLYLLPLTVLIVRKIGSPFEKEYGIGAIAENGTLLLDHASIQKLDISREAVEQTIQQEREELVRRIQQYRYGRSFPNLAGKTVVIVDDGLATGVTARAAIESIMKLNPAKIIFAAPVCAHETIRKLETQLVSVICMLQPSNLRAIGMYYQDFSQVTDQEVKDLLRRSSEFPKENQGNIYL